MQATKRKAAEIFFRRLVFFEKRETPATAGEGQSQVQKDLEYRCVFLAPLVHHLSASDQQGVDLADAI